MFRGYAFRSFLCASMAFATTSLAGCAAETNPASDPSTGEEMFTADIARSEQLLREAEAMADQVGCDGEFSQTQVADKIREAIAVRNTMFFRTRVVAKKAKLAKLFEGTLFWQEALGVYVPERPDTLPAALESGVTLWSTSPGGVVGSGTKIEFHPGGNATLWTLDAAAIFDDDPAPPEWHPTPMPWSYANGKVTVGDTTYSLKFERGELELSSEKSPSSIPDYISWKHCSG